MRAAHCLLILIAPLAVAPVSAQSRPDIPERARIRIQLQRADSSALQLSDGTRPVTFKERVGVAAGLPALGAVLGYAAWHDCNVPDREFAFGCLLFQGRLGTAVRGGAWLGLAVGLPFAVAMRKVERRRSVDRPSVASPFVGHSPRSGLMLGASFRF